MTDIKAEIGDRILIIDAMTMTKAYKNGDILTVEAEIGRAHV